MSDSIQDSVQNDTHSDYQSVKQAAAMAMQKGVWQDRFEPRFEAFDEREMRCDLSRESIDVISQGKHFMHYKGIPIAKDPLDKTLYEMLFFEVQPKTIIELGAYTGASALWMADSLTNIGLSSKVIAVDIDLTLIDGRAKLHPNVEFRQGDCNQIESVFTQEELATMLHPIVLIDDAHVNLPKVYQHFHHHAFHDGDYLIIEDTNPAIPGTFGSSDEPVEWGDWKHQEIKSFFQLHGQQYLVDRYYTDFFWLQRHLELERFYPSHVLSLLRSVSSG